MTGRVGPTARLCEWVCSTRLEDLPDEVRKEAATIVYDTIGGMIACSTLSSCEPVVAMVKSMGGILDCSIVGHPVKTTVTYAALANGTIAHGDETDATGQHGTFHFAAVVVPAAMCVGQHLNASGKEFIRAVALGCEVAARINSVLADLLEHYRRRGGCGNHLGAAVAAGLLMNLNAEEMEHALALAAIQAGGLNAILHDPSHQSKSLQYGSAAHAGVVAALLARAGFHGPPEILAIENGFFDTFAGYPNLANRVVDKLGEIYMMRYVHYKRYSVGGPGQTPLFVFLGLLKSHQLAADDIDQLDVALSRNAFITAATFKHPSVYLPTILSLAAVFGEVTFEHIHKASYYQDPRVEAFRERIRLLPDPGAGSHREARVVVRTRDGKVLSQQMGLRLMSDDEIQQKFRYLAGLRMDAQKALDLEGNIKSIEALDDVAPLIGQLELS